VPIADGRRGAADLHVHTTHSDGICSPGEVVRAAAAVGLAALAITDHDTLTALAVARPEAERLGVELVAGAELTVEHEGRELHLLAYFVRDDDPALVAAVTRLRDARAARLTALADHLAAAGLDVDVDAIRRRAPRAALGRRHLADWLVQTGQVANHRAAFAHYLGDRATGGIPKPRLPATEALALVRDASGVAALAHPPYDLRESELRSLVTAGLGAIEVVGPGVTRRQADRRRERADRLGLIPVAGSDFHAPDRPGRWVGSIVTPPADLARLRAAADPG